jgi:hypothetical protein
MEADPEEQGTMAGRPASVGDEEKVQLVTEVTTAENVTSPPPEPNEVGDAAKETTPGDDGPATVTATFGVLTFFDPRASKANL